jgi:hypothetical protein
VTAANLGKRLLAMIAALDRLAFLVVGEPRLQATFLESSVRLTPHKPLTFLFLNWGKIWKNLRVIMECVP